MPDVKVSVRDLSVYYDGQRALSGVTLPIYAHEILAVFGPANSGKSTLLRALNRLVDLVEGSLVQGQVFLDGKNIYDPDVDVINLRRRVGMVFALPIPLPGTIWENITYGPRLAGLHDRRRLDELVERTLKQAALWDEVKDRLYEPAVALSGGQQQRLCIARSLALEPDVILLDEPTSGLDPISTLKVEESLQELKHNYTIVIVPSNVQQAARVADHAAFFLMGELIEHAPGRKLFTDPQDKRTDDYVTGRFG
jgi:phosphate transport system ATP-binding protein